MLVSVICGEKLGKYLQKVEQSIVLYVYMCVHFALL